MDNPFVYGEVVPASAFVDRETELARLSEDLLAGQKVFLISPRRYGKSSLVGQALRAAARRGSLAVSVTVSSYSSYVAFLEGYARAILTADAKPDRVRAWLAGFLGALRPEVRMERGSHFSLAFPAVRTKADTARLAEAVFALPGQIADQRRRRLAIALDEFARPFSTSARSATSSRAPSRR
jgi:AAA+ ATPase superfamily predicted ATPase